MIVKVKKIFIVSFIILFGIVLIRMLSNYFFCINMDDLEKESFSVFSFAQDKIDKIELEQDNHVITITTANEV